MDVHIEHSHFWRAVIQESEMVRTAADLINAVIGRKLDPGLSAAARDAVLRPLLGTVAEVPGFGRMKLVWKWKSFQVVHAESMSKRAIRQRRRAGRI